MTGELLWMYDLNRKVDQLTVLMSSFAPVVKDLKQAYDADRQMNDGDDMPEGETDDEHSTNRAAAVVAATDTALANQSDVLVDELIHEMTENEPTDQPLPTKISNILPAFCRSSIYKISRERYHCYKHAWTGQVYLQYLS